MKRVSARHSSKTVLQHLSRVCLIALSISVVSIRPVFALDLDTTGPVIEFEELAEGDADQTQVFTVLIAEDGLLLDATLYYRRVGQLPFTPAPMHALSDTGYYSVSIPTDNTDLRTIEYYIQARDSAGNRTVSGFAFDPYQRKLKTSSSISLSSAEQTSDQALNTRSEEANIPLILRQRWVQITLGVVAAGLLASMASEDDGDSQVVPLTFNLK